MTNSWDKTPSQLCTGAVCQTYETCVSRLVEPIQLSFTGSKRAPVGCNSGVVDMPLNEAPIAVPSNGPVWNSALVIVRLPAPGWFCTMTAGLAGGCVAQVRAHKRALMLLAAPTA